MINLRCRYAFNFRIHANQLRLLLLLSFQLRILYRLQEVNEIFAWSLVDHIFLRLADLCFFCDLIVLQYWKFESTQTSLPWWKSKHFRHLLFIFLFPLPWWTLAWVLSLTLVAWMGSPQVCMSQWFHSGIADIWGHFWHLASKFASEPGRDRRYLRTLRRLRWRKIVCRLRGHFRSVPHQGLQILLSYHLRHPRVALVIGQWLFEENLEQVN